MNKQKEELTILVPFKNRYDNLEVFVPYMKYYMNNNFPNINYNIVVIEQDNDLLFNKGLLFNSGFLLTSGNTDYYVLHDIDELPISANYKYNDTPMHICVNIFQQNNTGIIKNEYEDVGFEHGGGAVLINKEKYIKVNGHSNLFWGKCNVDINFRWRCSWAYVDMYRYKSTIEKENDVGFFLSLKYKTPYTNTDLTSGKMIYEKTKSQEIPWQKDGLNSTEFTLNDVIKEKDYTLYKVNFNYDKYQI